MSGVPTRTYKLTTIQDAVTVGTTLSRSWYRGHSRIVGELTPRVYRGDIADDVVRALRPFYELEFIDAFRNGAPTLAEAPIPAAEDRLGWLVLMQHYRTPTRLLDWTTSVLIALHFAVSGDAGLDGEIWAMYPIALNERAGIGSGFPMLGQNILLEFLIQQPYWAASPEKLAARLEMAAVPKRPIAFQPPVSFRRMLGQLSKFTIHPPPAPGNTIPDILMKPEYLVRYIVPARYKNRLRNQLAVLGVADFVLFPDLEGLSRHLVESHKVLTYSVPEPPECSGPWDGSAD